MDESMEESIDRPTEKSTDKSKRFVTTIFVAVLVFFGLLVTLGEMGVLPFDFPTWNEIFEAVGLTDEDSLKNKMRVSFIDVGQGDSILISVAEGNILIDASEDEYGETVVDYLENNNVERLDYLIATHPHSDHIGGLPDVLSAFGVDNVIMPKISKDKTPTTSVYLKLLKAVKASGAKVIAAKVGNTYTLGGLTMTVLSPKGQYDDLNDMSVVVSVSFGETKFLFTGDASKKAEKDILKGAYASYLDSDVLKVGHHGSRYSNSKQFLKAVSPEISVISCGKGNDYGHPHAEVVKALKKVGTTIYRTDKLGTVVIESDGTSVSVVSGE